MRGGIYVLNFYSAIFVDQLKRGRKTATIRLGDKTNKYERGQVVWVTVGFRHSPREKIFTAVIDDVEVKRVADLSPRDIEHDNPEFRRLEETAKFLEQIYGRTISDDDMVTVIRFSQIVEPPGAISATERRRTTIDRLPFVLAGRCRLVPHHLACWSRRASRSGRRSTTRRAGRSGGAGSRRPKRCAAATRAASARSRGGLEEPAALPGRVRGDDDQGRAAARCWRATRSASSRGVGRWRLYEQDGITAVLYEWNVATSKAWMNLLAPLLRPVFEWNHDWVMARGGEGIAQPLGCGFLALLATRPRSPPTALKQRYLSSCWHSPAECQTR